MKANITTRGLVPILLACLAPACVTVKPVVLDRKTQLENQVLGRYQRLQKELVLASSVRGGETPGAKLSPLQREAAEAMLLREFIRDDVEQLRAQKAAGEGNKGELVLLSPPEDAKEAASARALVKQENAARRLIISRVIQLDATLSDKDLPLVRRIFQRLQRAAVLPGDLVQQDDGTWVEFKR